MIAELGTVGSNAVEILNSCTYHISAPDFVWVDDEHYMHILCLFKAFVKKRHVVTVVRCKRESCSILLVGSRSAITLYTSECNQDLYV